MPQEIVQLDITQNSCGPYGLMACVFISFVVMKELLTSVAPLNKLYLTPARFPLLVDMFRAHIRTGADIHEKFCGRSFSRFFFEHKDVYTAYTECQFNSHLSIIQPEIGGLYQEGFQGHAISDPQSFDLAFSAADFKKGEAVFDPRNKYAIRCGSRRRKHSFVIIRCSNEWFLFDSLSNIHSPSAHIARFYGPDATECLKIYLTTTGDLTLYTGLQCEFYCLK